MDLGIAGRTAAVAGASGGLGLATARALAGEGVRVAVASRDRDRIESAARVVGDDAVPLVADVSTTEGAAAFVAEAARALGQVDILVCNAGGPPAGTFDSTPVEDYLPALQLNLLSTVAMCKEAVPAMRERGWGRVLAITSVTVRQPSPMLILSNTARTGATAFLKTLATEVAADGVTVNSIQPGFHDTDRLRSLAPDPTALLDQVPARAIGDPDDFAAVAAFLCSEPARYITGAAVPVDGGRAEGLL